MAGTDTISSGYPGGGAYTNPGGSDATENIVKRKPILEKSKSVSYTSGAVSDQIFAISKDVSGTTAESVPKAVRVSNPGTCPIVVMTGYESFSDVGTSAGDVVYLHTMLMPGDSFIPPLRAAISTHDDKFLLDGTALDNQAPDSNEYTDSTANTDDTTATNNVDNSATNTLVYLEPYTSAANCTANLFRVGDLIRIRDEIMEVTAIGAKAALATNTLTVKRGLYGSEATSNTDDEDPVRFPFFNAYHNYNKFSTAQTDKTGRFKCFNMFGQGRKANNAVGSLQGITPGSFSMKFYTEGGHQGLGLQDINTNSITGLTASTLYGINITVDGGSEFANLSFTTDSANLRFGGTNGLLSKNQDALNTQYYTAGNLFEKKVTVTIQNGDLLFQSGSNLSTSAIALANATGGGGVNNMFGVGRIPAIGSISGAVASSLPDDVTYDPITYSTSPNVKAFACDNGRGRILGSAQGRINYETGAIDITGAPPEAEFVYSVIHSGAFSGKLDAEDTHKNALVDIYVNTTSQKKAGKVKVESW